MQTGQDVIPHKDKTTHISYVFFKFIFYVINHVCLINLSSTKKVNRKILVNIFFFAGRGLLWEVWGLGFDFFFGGGVPVIILFRILISMVKTLFKIEKLRIPSPKYIMHIVIHNCNVSIIF